MNEIDSNETIDAGGILEILDPSGHVEVRWGKKKSEVDVAEATFKDLLSKGYLAFKKTWLGRKGSELKEFDPKARAMIFDKVEAASVPLPVIKDEEPEKAKAKAEKEAEDAKKQERIDVAKKAQAEASEKVMSAKRDHEETTRKRREARIAKEEAERELAKVNETLQAARSRREETQKALESSQQGREAPKPETPETVSEAAVEFAGALALVALRREHEAAVAAEVAAQAAHEEDTAKFENAKIAWSDAEKAEEVSYEQKREAEKYAREREREYDDAMTALHGEHTNEQTREFDKKARTTMAPPLRGG